MKKALKRNATLGLLGLLVIFACAPFGNLLNPEETSPEVPLPSATADAMLSEQVPSEIVSAVPASTVTPALQSTLPPASRPRGR